MNSVKTAVAAMIVLFSMNAMAEMYKCEKSGKVSYQAFPCSSGSESNQLNIKPVEPRKELSEKSPGLNARLTEDELNGKLTKIQSEADTKLQLIEQKYAHDLELVKGDFDETKKIETRKNLEKLAVNEELKTQLEAEIARLTALYEHENQAAEDSRKAIIELDRKHKERMRALDRGDVSGAMYLQ